MVINIIHLHRDFGADIGVYECEVVPRKDETLIIAEKKYIVRDVEYSIGAGGKWYCDNVNVYVES